MALILLVEDDLLNREMIARYLLIQGFDVITAVDGVPVRVKEALRRGVLQSWWPMALLTCHWLLYTRN